MSSSPFDVSGMVVLVTGGTRGIGLEICRLLLQQGASVCAGGLDENEASAARDELRAHAAGLATVVCDIAAERGAVELVSAAIQRFGRLDAVICNAGIDVIKPALDYAEAEWDRIMAVNLKGAFLVARSAARAWIAAGQRGGSIVMTSSIAARAGIPQLAPYSASKGGLDQLVRTLAVEWAPHGIRVNAIAPGYVENIMSGVTVHANPGAEAQIREATPLGRRARLEEIAAPFQFLISRAASYVTGAVLAVDGGYTAK